jgi:hypothetical protein
MLHPDGLFQVPVEVNVCTLGVLPVPVNAVLCVVESGNVIELPLTVIVIFNS